MGSSKQEIQQSIDDIHDVLDDPYTQFTLRELFEMQAELDDLYDQLHKEKEAE